jgi:DNA-directed RNA polymerase subunit RPC12/RpoP
VHAHLSAAPDADQEPEYRCTGCSRLLFADELERFACRICEQRATKQLTELPHLYEELGNVLAPGASTQTSGRVRTSKTAPLPVALQPLSLRAPGGIVAGLQAIEDSWRAALGWTMAPRTDGVRVFAPWRTNPQAAIPEHTRFITNNLLWACASYEEVAYDLDVIGDLYWQAKNTITGTRPRLIPVRCRLLYDDGTECGEKMAVDINKTSARCPSCGTRWGREEWVALYEATRGIAA